MSEDVQNPTVHPELCKIFADVQNQPKSANPPVCAFLTTHQSPPQKVAPNATPEMWNEIVQQMFCELSILMFSRVSLFGVFGCDCAPQELYFDVLSPYNKMLYRISEKLVRHFDVSWLRIYGLLHLASMFLTPRQIFMTFLVSG